MAIKIIAEAVSNLFKPILKKKNSDIRVINMHLTIGDKSYNCYEDDIDIEEFSKTYYEMMKEGKEVKTSLVNPNEYEAIFKEEIEKGNQVICFTMASGISGTYQSACIARDLVNEEYKEEKVAVIDSITAGFGEGLQALHAEELVKEGKSFKEVKEAVEVYKHLVRSDFTVGDIKYLLKTGRVSKYVVKFVNALNFRVMLKNSEEAKIAFAGIVKGKAASIRKLFKTVSEKIDRSIKQIVYITHCNCLEDANELKDLLNKDGINDVEIYYYDLISGAHIGPGSLAVFYKAA